MKQRSLLRWAVPAAVVLIAAGAALTWYLSRPRRTDEQQLVRLVSKAQEAVEERNAAGLTRLLSDSYRDPEGNDKHRLTGQIVAGLRGSESFHVVPTVTALQVQGDSADMRLNVRYFGAEANSGGEEFSLSLRWRKEGRSWRVVSASGYSAAAPAID